MLGILELCRLFCCFLYVLLFFYVGGMTNVYRGLPGGAFHLLGYMTDTQTIVDDDCIPMKYDESPAKIRCLDRTCFKFSVCFYTIFCFLVVAGITVSIPPFSFS
ncbi:hypothetical protein HanOQP8_Chr12g0457631 [Helianthus annuus]|nr:hypothetical protein HanOQP8_Chr12g0457631 [Helianthus annuus]